MARPRQFTIKRRIGRGRKKRLPRLGAGPVLFYLLITAAAALAAIILMSRYWVS